MHFMTVKERKKLPDLVRKKEGAFTAVIADAKF